MSFIALLVMNLLLFGYVLYLQRELAAIKRGRVNYLDQLNVWLLARQLEHEEALQRK